MKDRRHEGFTLAELLVVVTIIGILVAISIPIFSSQLEKARKAVDLANVRSAKAAAAAEYLTTDMKSTVTYYYDAASGKVTDLKTARESVEGYGKSHSPFDEATDGATGTPNVGTASGIVSVTVSPDGTQIAKWELKGFVSVTADNVNDYVVTDENGSRSLEFTAGSLSYVGITSGSILKSVDDKASIKSIVFGENNDFETEDNPLDNGDTNQGVIFGRESESALSGYSSLESIDFSGITIGQIDMSNLSQVGVNNLKKVTLPNQSDLKFDIQGKWYYIDSNGNKVALGQGAVNKSNSRVDESSNPALRGAIIYREE